MAANIISARQQESKRDSTRRAMLTEQEIDVLARISWEMSERFKSQVRRVHREQERLSRMHARYIYTSRGF